MLSLRVQDYIQTLGSCQSALVNGQTFDISLYLGVNFMEKTISVRRTTITFSIWDLGGQFAPLPAVSLPLT